MRRPPLFALGGVLVVAGLIASGCESAEKPLAGAKVVTVTPAGCRQQFRFLANALLD